ncbi:MAG: NAD(P)-dependent glycerol-3-phosphate dehydrogenase [Verrucomicrobia bacterium]|nr:NAD(P)-dependent glycerol-3-phosphate dehydrogenase [Verrucomicrobiota bacterium]
MNLTIVGAGAWGTALGLVLQQNDHRITVWGHDPAHLAEAAAALENRRYLPGVPLPPAWRFEPDLDAAVRDAEGIILSVPSRALRDLSARFGGFQGLVVSTTKGLEHSTGLTMSGVLSETVPGARIAALSGPSLAAEVARNAPTAVVTASRDAETGRQVQGLFHRPTFRVYTSSDVTGVELGGALKNVIAIAAGACDGFGFGNNSKAALVTRGLAEMTRIGMARGARPETFAGLSGMGDLTVTCFSPMSRNRSFGERMCRGGSPAELLASQAFVVEGYPTTQSAHALAQRLGLDAPITAEIHAALFEGKDPRQAVADILGRGSKAER